MEKLLMWMREQGSQFSIENHASITSMSLTTRGKTGLNSVTKNITNIRVEDAKYLILTDTLEQMVEEITQREQDNASDPETASSESSQKTRREHLEPSEVGGRRPT